MVKDTKIVRSTSVLNEKDGHYSIRKKKLKNNIGSNLATPFVDRKSMGYNSSLKQRS